MVNVPRFPAGDRSRQAFQANRHGLVQVYEAALERALNQNQFPQDSEKDESEEETLLGQGYDGIKSDDPIQPAKIVTFTILGTPFLGYRLNWTVELACQAVRNWFTANPNAHNVIGTVRFMVPGTRAIEQRPLEHRSAWIDYWQ